MNKEELEKIIAETTNKTVRDEAIKKLEQLNADDQDTQDDVTKQLVGLSALLSNVGVDDKEVKKIVEKELERRKISIDNLDQKLKDIIQGLSTQINVNITTASGKIITKVVTLDPEIKRPLMQKVLSDVAARNNVYLYGGAGTGKTFAAKTIARALGWDLIEVGCNQFTSQLELIGGQTIDGYQEGKVVRAFGNINEFGGEMKDENGNPKGCVLLLDELPKIDPNTAGILNSALAKSGEYDSYVVGDKRIFKAPTIQNGKGEKIKRKQVFIMGTGNSLLNSLDEEYEANFKQDLSLQDRFAGSTYEVFVDKPFEWENILFKKWAFIYIYLSKLRAEIVAKKFTAKAFVSIRLMMSAQKTYNVFRKVTDAKGKNAKYTPVPDISYTPASNNGVALLQKSTVKTLKDTLDEFFNLFSDSQAKELKESTDYKGFLNIVKLKNKVPIDELNTKEELEEVMQIISKK